jgi:feruloyl esterase
MIRNSFRGGIQALQRVPKWARWAVAAVVLMPGAWAQAQRDAKASACSTLAARVSIADTTIETVQVVADGKFVSPQLPPITKLPEFCRVAAMTKPQIRFEVWMPLKGWNGRFEVDGNGGMAGTISYRAMAAALRRGDAVASTDTGHVAKAGEGFDASWSLGRPDLVADFGYRALHLTTVYGKLVVQAFYAKSAEHSYYVGCSKGGGQGLMEAQRFPSDFDGILAGDPANNWTGLYAGSHLWYSIATLRDTESYIPASKVPLLASAVNKACDAKDGIADGVIDDPRVCHFDPAALLCKPGEDEKSCLTAKQVQAVKDIWSGVRDGEGKLVFPGLMPGGEDGSGGWSSWITGAAPRLGTHWRAADGFFRYTVYRNEKYDPMDFDYEKDMGALKKVAPMVDATDADLRPFQRHGGKLILYHGWSDPDISPLNTISYYKQVEEKVGEETPEFARLFMVPGMQHCGGGPGPNTFDAVTALERWVEKGVAPERIVATHSTLGKVDMSRPLCAYPEAAVYDGKGSTKDASSFVCREPKP